MGFKPKAQPITEEVIPPKKPANGEIGFIRNFESLPNKDYEIVEVLEEPAITMSWNWKETMCPHCKRNIINTKIHDFFRIEILVDINKKNSKNPDDIICLGFSRDEQTMFLTREKMAEAFQKSVNFKDVEIDIE